MFWESGRISFFGNIFVFSLRERVGRYDKRLWFFEVFRIIYLEFIVEVWIIGIIFYVISVSGENESEYTVGDVGFFILEYLMW